MNSTKERLAKAKENPFLVGLAAGAKSPNDLSERVIKDLKERGIELTEEEGKIAREVAKTKRDRKKIFKAIFSEVLERERLKEFKMTLKERLEEFKQKGQVLDIQHSSLTSWGGRLTGKIKEVGDDFVNVEVPGRGSPVIIPITGIVVEPRYKVNKASDSDLTEKQEKALKILIKKFPKKRQKLLKMIKGSREKRQWTTFSGTLACIGGVAIIVASVFLGIWLQRVTGLPGDQIILGCVIGAVAIVVTGYSKLLKRYFIQVVYCIELV